MNENVVKCEGCGGPITVAPKVHYHGDDPYHPECYNQVFMVDLTHRVHKEMTSEKFKNNDQSVGMGTDFESFMLNEHLLSLAKYYGIDILESAIKECSDISKSV